MTVLVYASGYSELSGVHFRLGWPRDWMLVCLDRVRLPGQILGYAGTGLHDMAYAAVFHCLTGGTPQAVARFDVHVNSPGSVAFDHTNPLLRILDCELGEQDLELSGDGVHANFDREQRPTLRRIGPATGSGGAMYEVSLDHPVQLSARVYDVSGRLVRVLEPGDRNADGVQQIGWDGTSGRGEAVAAGVYLLEFRLGELRLVERALIVR